MLKIALPRLLKMKSIFYISHYEYYESSEPITYQFSRLNGVKGSSQVSYIYVENYTCFSRAFRCQRVEWL